MNGYKKIPVIFGSEANIIPEDQRDFPELSHKWKCYVKISPSHVKSVHFKLHESFKNPHITVTEPPYEINEQGWGEFTIHIKVTLFNDEKISTSHYLKLHGENYPVINERIDTIFYKGKAMKIEEEYNFEYVGESEENQKIEDAINYMIEAFEKNV